MAIFLKGHDGSFWLPSNNSNIEYLIIDIQNRNSVPSRFWNFE